MVVEDAGELLGGWRRSSWCLVNGSTADSASPMQKVGFNADEVEHAFVKRHLRAQPCEQEMRPRTPACKYRHTPGR